MQMSEATDTPRENPDEGNHEAPTEEPSEKTKQPVIDPGISRHAALTALWAAEDTHDGPVTTGLVIDEAEELDRLAGRASPRPSRVRPLVTEDDPQRSDDPDQGAVVPPSPPGVLQAKQRDRCKPSVDPQTGSSSRRTNRPQKEGDTARPPTHLRNDDREARSNPTVHCPDDGARGFVVSHPIYQVLWVPTRCRSRGIILNDEM